ncbi:MAG: hypothetical protein MK137_08085, partial [Rickettsiales bacterium]|nr:hypothetical protein [Rickettsiales bacterium]
GMTHPLMTWTGPKAASFFPPQVTIKAQHAASIANILEQNNIKEAIMVKVVPSEDGVILQVTEQNDTPRRYFDLSSGEERIGYDEQQAIWLARYYTGLKDQHIKSVIFQSEFDAAYPWVDRLLPVYRVTFDTDDNRSAFIYTELGALAGLTNDYKTTIQSIFRALHTWNWLDQFENARVFLMLLLLLSLFGLAATGTAMIFLMKNRKMDKKRKLHRYISYGIWIPLLAFSSSGIYHLIQYAYGDNHRGLQLGASINVETGRFGSNTSWLDLYQNVTLNGLSVVEGINGNLLYRLSIPQGRPGKKIDRATRFDGVPIEKPALYFDAKTGEEARVSDQDMAIFYATKLLGFDQSQIVNTKRVTRFGPHYDFRNKRLPVWRIDYDTELGDRLFIDPATGMLVDRLVNAQRYESYSFSFLHKWNFLTPLTGRMPRDVIIVVILSFAVLATLLGYVMILRPKRKKRR